MFKTLRAENKERKTLKIYGIQQFCIFHGIFADYAGVVLSDSRKVSEGTESLAFDCQPDFLQLGRAEIYCGHGVLHRL